MVVGVIERLSIRLQPFSAQNGVIEDALHAVAIPSVARHSQQIASQFEMCVTAARRLKAAVRLVQTCVKCTAIRRDKALIRPPAAGSETLCSGDHLEGIARGTQMLFAPVRKISLHRRAQRIAKT